MQTGATVTEMKSISAAKPSRGSGQTRQRKAARRGSANVLWKRVTAAYDEDVRNFAKNPALVSPITRWVLFEHLTPTQGMAARRYADIMGEFGRFTIPIHSRSARSANLEPSAAAEDNEIQRRILNGSIDDYEHEAKYAKRQHKRLMKVLARYADPASGRNGAKDALDNLCLADQEPPAQLRKDIAIVLTAIAKEFGLGEHRKVEK
jgi:hypothetical protein